MPLPIADMKGHHGAKEVGASQYILAASVLRMSGILMDLEKADLWGDGG